MIFYTVVTPVHPYICIETYIEKILYTLCFVSIHILLGCITYMGYHRTREKFYTYMRYHRTREMFYTCHRKSLQIIVCCNHRTSPVFYTF